MFSKTCEYALRSAITISKYSLDGKLINLKDITEILESPQSFTAKIVQQLSKNKIVESTKGPMGGYKISIEKMKSVKIIDIVKNFDGIDIMEKCILGLRECNDQNPCTFHNKYAPIRRLLSKELTDCTLFDIASGKKEIFQVKL